MREELLSPEADPAEVAEETTLRPRHLEEFVGQPRLREHLEIMLTAAKQRGQAVDHVLLAGPPGLGKTTLAGIIANEMGARTTPTSGPALERAGGDARALERGQLERHGALLAALDPVAVVQQQHARSAHEVGLT